MKTDAEIYDAVAPHVAALAETAARSMADLSGYHLATAFDAAAIRSLVELADNLIGATSGCELFVAASTRGMVGPTSDRASAENAFVGLAAGDRALWAAVGFWSDLLTSQVRQDDEATARAAKPPKK